MQGLTSLRLEHMAHLLQVRPCLCMHYMLLAALALFLCGRPILRLAASCVALGLQ